MPEYFEKEILKTWAKEFITTNPLFLKALDYAPSADVEPVRHGHWEEAIRTRRSIAGKIEDFRCYECSACGERSLCETKYCPRCGAKMAEEGYNENSNTNTTRLL